MAMFSASPPSPPKDTNDSRQDRQGHAAMQLFAAMQQPPELNAESGAPGYYAGTVGCETWKVLFGWLGLWMILMMFFLVH